MGWANRMGWANFAYRIEVVIVWARVSRMVGVRVFLIIYVLSTPLLVHLFGLRWFLNRPEYDFLKVKN